MRTPFKIIFNKKLCIIIKIIKNNLEFVFKKSCRIN